MVVGDTINVNRSEMDFPRSGELIGSSNRRNWAKEGCKDPVEEGAQRCSDQVSSEPIPDFGIRVGFDLGNFEWQNVENLIKVSICHND